MTRPFLLWPLGFGACPGGFGEHGGVDASFALLQTDCMKKKWLQCF